MSKKNKSNYSSTSINSHEHNDKRANIPTEELRSFVADDERKPNIVRYPRDPSLDPQLVWNGKDEQDSQDLEVLAVPIYIQEIIKPESIVKGFLEHQKQQVEEQQMDLFADSHDLPFSEKIDFYRHETGWKNRMILGDSLLVMNSLAEKEGLKGKVK